MPRCRHCKDELPADHLACVVHKLCQLHGPWSGWRMDGRDLVSPDGDRPRLAGTRRGCATHHGKPVIADW